jgi:aspartokinase/homoserine dehydrogenase 1
MRVLKFGGSSVGSADAIRLVVGIVRRSLDEQGAAAVVVSAFAGVTDELLAMARSAARDEPFAPRHAALERRHTDVARALLPAAARDAVVEHIERQCHSLRELLCGAALTGELSPRLQDAILSFGERLSAYIVAACLTAAEIDAAYLDMRELVRTDATFGAARVERDITYASIRRYFEATPRLQVATGFIGATADGQTTTLGRGGSDYTAALLGAALDADAIEIWTDVDGVLTADPRRVPEAFPLEALTYEEAMELAHFGAKVIYPPTIQPALVRRIPLHIRNTFRSESPGTLIADRKVPSAHAITSLTSMSSVALLLVQGSGMIGAAGTAMRLFGALARRQISAILITQASSEHTICVGVVPQLVDAAVTSLEAEFALEIQTGQLEPVTVRTDCSVVTVVGEGMRERPGIASTLFSALAARRINVVAIAQGSSELNISVVVAQRDEATALRAIHEAFFAPSRSHVYLFVVGTGLVGGTLLRLLGAQATWSRAEREVQLHLRGLANSRRMLIDPDADVDPATWEARLAADELEVDLDAFVAGAAALGLPNSVVIDCTASEAPPARYADALRSGVSVVTANKRGLTGPRERYADLRHVATSGRATVCYETTVGAALPVLGPLRDLLATGDTVLGIEAVLSGTLSYLFNAFDGTQPFSELLCSAQRAGYTEPDPRDDLSGADVARKLLILARECDGTTDLADISVDRFLSQTCLAAPSLEAFYEALADEDARLERRRAAAARRGKVLRYVARRQAGRCSVALEAVPGNHPFAALRGSENCVIFHTARYAAQPLVIRGPGAGAEVTAAGVLGDILRVAERSPRV